MTTEDSGKEENTRQEQGTEEQAEEAETPEQTTVMDKTTEAKTVTSPDRESNSAGEIREEKEMEPDKQTASVAWWLYALLGPGILCIIAGTSLLLSETKAKEKRREHKDEKNN